MFFKRQWVLIFTFIFFPFFLYGQNSHLLEFYRIFLEKKGYKPEVKEDIILFKLAGGTYVIEIYEDDPQFFRLIYPNFWKLENEDELLMALIAANESNRVSKTGKILIEKGQTFATVEIFIDKPEQIELIFIRCLAALDNSVKNFAQRMKEMQEKQK